MAPDSMKNLGFQDMAEAEKHSQDVGANLEVQDGDAAKKR